MPSVSLSGAAPSSPPPASTNDYSQKRICTDNRISNRLFNKDLPQFSHHKERETGLWEMTLERLQAGVVPIRSFPQRDFRGTKDLFHP